MTKLSSATKAFIAGLVQATKAASPEDAIRLKARQLLELYQQTFGQPDIPIDVNLLASLIGVRTSDYPPLHSPDAEIGPDGNGGVEIRVNPDRPETRKRFSIAHEISHTFFPEYQQKAWCRTDARFRTKSDPDQYIEILCDIGAAELLLPVPWFADDAAAARSAGDLVNLAYKYHASREAVLRRLAELSEKPIAAVFFSWKLKPSQKGVVGNPDQPNLFGVSPEEEIRETLQLRIDYPIYSAPFRRLGLFIPPDKSIGRDGPVYEAAVTGECVSGEAFLQLGQASGIYKVSAIPLPTATGSFGPLGEHNVAAVLEPADTKVKRPAKNAVAKEATSLFE